MNYIDAVVFLLDGHTDRLMGLADDVERVTGSEAARAGAVVLLLLVSLLSVLLGLALLLVAAPFYAAWAALALLWVGVRTAIGYSRIEE